MQRENRVNALRKKIMNVVERDKEKNIKNNIKKRYKYNTRIIYDKKSANFHRKFSLLPCRHALL